MRLIDTFRRRQRRRRLRKQGRGDGTTLREFVYLDEISVVSLLSSRRGAITTEMTETEASSLQTEVSSSASVDALVAQGSVGSRLQADASQSRQAVRKAVIQATFKDLYDSEWPRLALRSSADVAPKPFATRDDLIRAAGSGDLTGFAIRSRDLARGSLVEVEVALETEPIYRVEAIVTDLLDMMRDRPSLYGVSDPQQFDDMVAVSQMLEKLMRGLVPLRGRVLNFGVVRSAEDEWVVRTDLLPPDLEDPDAVDPLLLVGIAEEALFWKDLRRVLFSGAPYRVLARIARPGLNATWTPIKLVDTLRDVIPGAAATLESLNRGVLGSFAGRDALPSGRDPAHRQELVAATLREYASMLAQSTGAVLDADEVDRAVAAIAAQDPPFNTALERRAALEPMTKTVEEALDSPVDREVAARLRSAAYEKHRTTSIVTARTSIEPGESVEPGSRPDRILDCELVAIYW